MRGIGNIATRVPLLIRVVSLYAVTFLIVVLGQYIYSTTTAATVNTLKIATVSRVNKGPVIVKEIIDGEPISLQISRLGINLPIKYGVYNAATGEWTLSDDAVYFAQITALPNNQRGSTFLYGHNNRKVLEPLAGLVVGDIAEVLTTNGHTFTYVYISSDIVPPNFGSVLYQNPETPRLTIMTCEGIWSQARRLMYFDFVEVK